MRQSGTSCATPIAAGLAAIVLDIASINLTEEDVSLQDRKQIWKNLRTRQGMSLVFEGMSNHRDGYDYIAPWTLIGLQRDVGIDYIMKTIFLDLRDNM